MVELIMDMLTLVQCEIPNVGDVGKCFCTVCSRCRLRPRRTPRAPQSRRVCSPSSPVPLPKHVSLPASDSAPHQLKNAYVIYTIFKYKSFMLKNLFVKTTSPFSNKGDILSSLITPSLSVNYNLCLTQIPLLRIILIQYLQPSKTGTRALFSTFKYFIIFYN